MGRSKESPFVVVWSEAAALGWAVEEAAFGLEGGFHDPQFFGGGPEAHREYCAKYVEGLRSRGLQAAGKRNPVDSASGLAVYGRPTDSAT